MSFAGISLEALPLSTCGISQYQLNWYCNQFVLLIYWIVALITALSAAELAGLLASAVKLFILL
jgi:hypothetical protein